MGTTAIVGGLYYYKWRKRRAFTAIEETNSMQVKERLGIAARGQA